MLSTKGRVARLYPTEEQERIIKVCFDNVRFLYNYFLAERIRSYKEDGVSLNYAKTTKMLTALKRDKDHLWLNESDSMAEQEVLRNLDSAFQNFFAHRARFPRFHSKRSRQSYRTRNQVSKNGTHSIEVDGDKVKLPKVGWVRLSGLQPINGLIKHATVSKDTDGKYYISLCVKEEFEAKSNGGGKKGIDVGLKVFFTDSDGNTVVNPRTYVTREKKLSREQRKLHKKVKGSHNRSKQRKRLAAAYKKVANSRKDFLHKLTHELAIENQVVCVEKLNIRGMLRNRRLAKHISDAAWSEFFRQLSYKLFEHGGVLVKVPTFFPSSQTCHECGYKNQKVKDLSVREWVCPECGYHRDRDTNAAKNILRKGLEQLAELES